MPKTIRNKFDKILSYETLMEAHKKSRKGKGYRNEIIKFNLKQEEYIGTESKFKSIITQLKELVEFEV